MSSSGRRARRPADAHDLFTARRHDGYNNSTTDTTVTTRLLVLLAFCMRRAVCTAARRITLHRRSDMPPRPPRPTTVHGHSPRRTADLIGRRRAALARRTKGPTTVLPSGDGSVIYISEVASFAPGWVIYVTPPDIPGHSRFRARVYLCGRPRVRAGWPGGRYHSPHSAECYRTGFMM